MAMVEAISDPVVAKKPSKDYPWWVENIDHKITPEVSCKTIQEIYSLCKRSTNLSLQVRQHLETYSGIQSEDVYKHVYTIVSRKSPVDCATTISRPIARKGMVHPSISMYWNRHVPIACRLPSSRL